MLPLPDGVYLRPMKASDVPAVRTLHVCITLPFYRGSCSKFINRRAFSLPNTPPLSLFNYCSILGISV